MVDMHEVIGHASGQLAPNVGPANETLQSYAGTLEEGRADLVALYYLLDPKLVELKVAPSLEVGRAAYDAYIRSALLVQLAAHPARRAARRGAHAQSPADRQVGARARARRNKSSSASSAAARRTSRSATT